MKYFRAADINDIFRKNILKVDLDGLNLLLYRDKEDEIYCIENRCTHENFILSGGEVKDDTITCPHHGAKFNLKTGKALIMPAAAAIETFPVKLKGDEIFVGIEDY